MARRNRLRNCRPKAAFGVDGAITAAATIAAATMNALATKKAADTQAKATQEAASLQADALVKQNENANALQEKNIQFATEQNQLNRDIQKDVQMNLQLLTGQQNTMQRRDASKIQAKNGASKRLRNINQPSFLRGGFDNLPFQVTDGGDVIPLGSTSEGYDLYEIAGNDHSHYHKTRGGKNKTGVGIKFADGQIIEGEGNQNTNKGELLLVTPTDAKFISKHTIKGFNPRAAVMAGMHPIDAFNQQEAIKNLYGISDDGKTDYTHPVERIAAYGSDIVDTSLQDVGGDILAPASISIALANKADEQARNGKRVRCSLKNGGRAKAPYGTKSPISLNLTRMLSSYKPWDSVVGYDTLPTSQQDIARMIINGNTEDYAPVTTTKSSNSRFNLSGIDSTALVNAGANLLGAGITTWANRKASNMLTDANTVAADTIADAYSRMGGVDMSLMNRDNYRAAHAMAALQAPIVNTGAQRATAERSLQRNLRNINTNTISSAAAQNRSARAESDYNDRISSIEEAANQTRQSIIQNNMQRLNQVASDNANRDVQANQQFAQDYLALLQYNNDIANDKLAGIASARANALQQNAQVNAQTRNANAASWNSAINNIATQYINNVNTDRELMFNLASALAGSSNSVTNQQFKDNFNAGIDSAEDLLRRFRRPIRLRNI